MARKFELGSLVATAAVDNMMSEDKSFYNFVAKSLEKYRQCNWGDTCEEDAELNDYAVKNGERILAVYKSETGKTIWIITEWDRSATTVLFPEDY